MNSAQQALAVQVPQAPSQAKSIGWTDLVDALKNPHREGVHWCVQGLSPEDLTNLQKAASAKCMKVEESGGVLKMEMDGVPLVAAHNMLFSEYKERLQEACLKINGLTLCSGITSKLSYESIVMLASCLNKNHHLVGVNVDVQNMPAVLRYRTLPVELQKSPAH